MVSPETRSSVSPSSKATSAAISRVHRLVSYPNSLGERWSIPLRASALSASKAAWTRLGREEPAMRASRPLSLKARMAFLDRLRGAPEALGYLGRRDWPRALARRIWHRRITKAPWSAARLRGFRAPFPTVPGRKLEVSWKQL